MVQWLYKAVIRPVMSYAAVTWWKNPPTGTCKRIMNRVQRLACLSITGGMSTTPLAAMEAMLGLPPMHLVMDAEVIMGVYRIKASGMAELNTVRHRKTLAIMEQQSNLQMPADRISKEYNLDKPYEVFIPSREEGKRLLQSLGSRGEVWYTDGSKTPNGTGVGIRGEGPGNEFSVRLGQHATVFQAEIMGVYAAAGEALKGDNPARRHITIVSDSQAALQALGADLTSSKLVRDCIQVLRALANNNRVTLLWIPGHKGIKGNERADTLAKAGARNLIGPEPTCGIAYSEVKRTVKSLTEERHASGWEEGRGQRQSKLFLGRPGTRAKELISMTRENLREMTGLLTGHCHLNRHMHLLGLSDTSICRGCGEEDETPEHLLRQCEALVHLRRELFGKGKLTEDDCKILPLNKIQEFIGATGLREW